MHQLFRSLAVVAIPLVCAGACDAAPAKPVKVIAMPAADPQADALRDKLGRSVLDAPGVVLPDNHKALDAAMARRDWAYLTSVVRDPGSAENMMRLLNWERYQTYRGGGYGVTYMYVTTLAMAANSYDKAATKDPSFAQTARGLRMGALTQLLYTYAVVAVDGVRCADLTAPQAHRDQIAGFTDELRLSVNQLSHEERVTVLMAAVRQEQELAPVRDADPDLCRGGLDDLGDALESHREKGTTTGPHPGYPGTTVSVPIDPASPTKYSDRALWTVRQEKVRDGLPDALGALIGMTRNK
ncbi:hypothetical protein [Caulobacter sp. DWP3-1-3b2]|uniref:hypothetical protein n=1 Tax=Caulobacter sp. DWP3-1-3b2 TaxID=2804643 RepID=UPI003CEAE026